MPSLDTNCLLRWLLNDVPDHTRRVQQAIESHGRLTVADAALLEVGFILERSMRLPRSHVAASINALASEKAFVFDREFWRSVADEYQTRPKLSLVDVYLTHDAVRTDASPLLTLDAKLANQSDDAALI